MKKYLADILTFSRLILSIILLVLTFLGGNAGTAFFIFVLGELTDAFDGTCATKWPFPKNRTPEYRKYAAKYDMFADTLLIIAMFLYFIVRVNLIAGLVLGLGYGLAAIIIDFIVYGKLMGHPDDFRPGSLSARNFSLAKRIILMRRRIYIILIVLIATWTFVVSSLPDVVKITTVVISAFVGVFLWFFLGQRRKNISRDAVDIEKKLSK